MTDASLPRASAAGRLRLRATFDLAVWTAALVGAWVGLHQAGRVLPTPPVSSAGATLAWVEHTDPMLVAFGLLRWVGLGVTAYLLAVTALTVVGHVLHIRPALRLADLIAVPTLRRTLHHLVGVGLAVSLVGGGPLLVSAGAASAAPLSVPVASQIRTSTVHASASQATVSNGSPARLPATSPTSEDATTDAPPRVVMRVLPANDGTGADASTPTTAAPPTSASPAPPPTITMRVLPDAPQADLPMDLPPGLLPAPGGPGPDHPATDPSPAPTPTDDPTTTRGPDPNAPSSTTTITMTMTADSIAPDSAAPAPTSVDRTTPTTELGGRGATDPDAPTAGTTRPTLDAVPNPASDPPSGTAAAPTPSGPIDPAPIGTDASTSAPETPTGTASAVPPAAPAVWIIEPGDHLWHVATQTLTDAWHRDPTDAEVAAYLTTLIDHNRDRLAVRDNPDLVFPGQAFELPPLPPDSPPSRP